MILYLYLYNVWIFYASLSSCRGCMFSCASFIMIQAIQLHADSPSPFGHHRLSAQPRVKSTVPYPAYHNHHHQWPHQPAAYNCRSSWNMVAPLYITESGLLFHAGKILVLTVGLPARGKTHVSRALERYLRWTGVKIMVVSLGDFRRKIIGAAGKLPSDYFTLGALYLASIPCQKV